MFLSLREKLLKLAAYIFRRNLSPSFWPIRSTDDGERFLRNISPVVLTVSFFKKGHIDSIIDTRILTLYGNNKNVKLCQMCLSFSN